MLAGPRRDVPDGRRVISEEQALGSRAATAASLAIALLAPLLAGEARAQTPSPTPPVLPDNISDITDFEGRSSVALGSGARALGMGGAFLARADDATAASWNPAGLSYLRSPEVSLVWGRNTQSIEAPAAGTLRDEFAGYSPDLAAAAWPIELGSALGAVQLSFQRVFSFSGERAREQFINNQQRLFLTSGEGGFDVFALGSGLQVTRSLRLGATVNRWTGGWQQERQRLLVPGNRRLTADFDFELSGWNANFGLIYTPVPRLNLGAVYKTKFTGQVDLVQQRVDSFGVVSPETTTDNAAASDRLRLEIPAAVGVGASWRPYSTLTLSADWTRTFWSEGRIRNFFVVERAPIGEPDPKPVVIPELPYPTFDDFEQQDTTQVRLGLEYVVIRGPVRWPLRVGYFSDWQYFREAGGTTPRYDGFTLGTGVILGPTLLDIAWLRESGRYRQPDVAVPYEVSTRFDRLLVSLIYRRTSVSSSGPGDGTEPVAGAGTLTSDGTPGLFQVPSTTTVPRGTVALALFRENLDRNPRDVDASAHGIAAATGLTDRLEAHAGVVFEQRNDVDGATGPGAPNEYPFAPLTYRSRGGWARGFGDVRVGLKYSLRDASAGGGFGVALRGWAKLPTADANHGLGTGRPSFGGDVVASLQVDRAGEVHGLLGAARHLDPDRVDIADELRWAVGTTVPSRTRLQMQGEIRGQHWTGGRAVDLAGLAFERRNPLDLVLGPVLWIDEKVYVRPAISWNLRFSPPGLAQSSKSWTGLNLSIGYRPGSGARRPPASVE
jgi:long-subunit fatty acid transport protein